jgi:hypothetical protein
VYSGAIELCRYLLSHGLSVDDSPLGFLQYNDNLTIYYPDPVQMYEYLIEQGWLDMDFLNDPDQEDWWTSVPNSECLAVLQKSMLVPYSSLPLEERFRHTVRLPRRAGVDRLITALGAVDQAELEAAAVMRDDQYETLLNRLID